MGQNSRWIKSTGDQYHFILKINCVIYILLLDLVWQVSVKPINYQLSGGKIFSASFPFSLPPLGGGGGGRWGEARTEF